MTQISFGRALAAITSIALLAASIWLIPAAQPASAAPAFAAIGAHASQVVPAQIFRRGRPPIYPYYYNPGRPGGYSFYFGPVPYFKGDYGTQALQRRYPEANYPPSMRGWTPKSDWGP